MLSMFGNAFDLLLVILGFGLIIFIHELGHFVAARWAGIRVLAFAVGFGPAAFSYRTGMGLRRGSSEPDYLRLLAQARSPDPQTREQTRSILSGSEGKTRPISPTEYRLNWLPFGGYVKMLGQEDANPQAVSTAPDSYQSCPPLKRMVVISAGVVANVITAFLLFILVFMVGLRTEPATIGMVSPNGPAAQAKVISASDIEPGLKPGDRVLSVGDHEPRHFNDFGTSIAMSAPGRSVMVTVEREGFSEPLTLEVKPERGQASRLLEIGVSPVFSSTVDTTLLAVPDWQGVLDSMGLEGIEPGDRLVRINHTPVARLADLMQAARSSGGQPMTAEFERDNATTITRSIQPVPQFELDDASTEPGVIAPIDHLLGLMPVLRVGSTAERGAQQGLMAGDLFIRLGEIEYPSPLTGVREIQRHAGRTIEAVVLRTLDDGTTTQVSLSISVTRAGTIGFMYSAGDTDTNLFALPPTALRSLNSGERFQTAASRLITTPGVRITQIDQTPVESFVQIREALRDATRQAWTDGDEQATVSVVMQAHARGEPATREWTLNRTELDRLHALSYGLGRVAGIFELEQFTLKADNPAHAIVLGMSETHRIMQQAYLTFLRLFQGSVRVEHLRGPVGIAHIGTMLADRGMVWLIFYMAMVSINLAVVNFLPLPIVDGGQFLMLVYEQIRGKPVPMALQGALTLAGLALVGTVFLVVTFNDISNLLGR